MDEVPSSIYRPKKQALQLLKLKLILYLLIGKDSLIIFACRLTTAGKMSEANLAERFSAIRRQGFLPLNFLRRTELQLYHFPALRSTKPLLAYR
ncbi:MAG: hypothetical protein KF896_08735 [Ignavibacteriae bacterium]|nr:hypothetical protein [Ignavibacteriota bacterium]